MNKEKFRWESWITITILVLAVTIMLISISLIKKNNEIERLTERIVQLEYIVKGDK